MREKLGLGLAVVAAMALGAAAVIAASPGETKLGKCLPTNNEVAGWTIIANTYKYCPTPNSLSELYDGGFEVYVEAGIIKAASQGYKRGSKKIIVYIHEFKTATQCKSYWSKEVKRYGERYGKTTVTARDGAAYSKVGPQVIGNIYRGKVHAKVVALGTDKGQQEATAAFMKKISERIGKNY